MTDRKLFRTSIQPTPRNARAAAEFRDRRYAERGLHLGMVSDLMIDQTDVNRYINSLTDDNGFKRTMQINEMRLGDPTGYAGLGPYDGFHRHFKRFINNAHPSEYAGYLLAGDESLKTRIKMGRTKTPGYMRPENVEVVLTPGVAGALRLLNSALLLPPNQLTPTADVLEELQRRIRQDVLTDEDKSFLLTFLEKLKAGVAPDNVVIPEWTYVSHMAETSLAHADFKLCKLTTDGQVDLDDLRDVIDPNTRAILFATVGNPLTVAMEPEVFDSILRIVCEKSNEYDHPIAVLPDIIYEQYRRDHSKRIDAIQRALKLGTLGVHVPVMEMSSFSKMLAIPGERVGYIRVLWDPELFPITRTGFFKALKNVTGPTLNYVACSVQRALGAMYRSIKQKRPVEEELAPLAAVLTVLEDLSKSKELPIPLGDTAILFRQKNLRDKGEIPKNLKQALYKLGIEKGYFSAKKIGEATRKMSNTELSKYGVDLDTEMVLDIGKRLEDAGYVASMKVDEVTFYRINRKIPPVERGEDGQLKLYNISENPEWIELAKNCGVTTEDALYQEHKKRMRDTVYERVCYFAVGLENLRKKGLGVYLHPMYYDEKGELDLNRFNAFYVLWGLDKLRSSPSSRFSQARVLAEKCVELGRPIIATVPGENFLPSEMRSAGVSCMRSVALPPMAEIETILRTIELVARAIDGET